MGIEFLYFEIYNKTHELPGGRVLLSHKLLPNSNLSQGYPGGGVKIVAF